MVQMVNRRSRDGYVNHMVRRNVFVVPELDADGPSPHGDVNAPQASGFGGPDRGSAVSPNWMERKKAARNPDLSSELQMRLAKDRHLEVRKALAATTTHPNVVELLITDGTQVRYAMTANGDAFTLRRLALDPSSSIRQEAERRLAELDPGSTHSED
jgi:hypothetical protein